MQTRPRSEVPYYPIQPVAREPAKIFIPEVGGAAPVGKVPIGLPEVNERGRAGMPFEKEGHPVRNFFASILYGLGIVLRSGR